LLVALQQQLLPHKLRSLLLNKEQLALLRLHLLLLLLLVLQDVEWWQWLH
jgi:hypothetical protein